MNAFAPGNIDEMSPSTLVAWKSELDALLNDGVGAARQAAPSQPRAWFFNSVADGEDGSARLNVNWTAYPKLLGSTAADYASADRNRQRQEEYCEWAVRQGAGGPVEMIFSTETPDYYRFLFENDQTLLLSLYHQFIGNHVTLADLTDSAGRYNVTNVHNVPPAGDASGRIMHMGGNGANYYIAAIVLAAQASWPSIDDTGNPITDEQSLIACRRFGVAHRHSDPFIGGQVNQQVRLGNSVSLGGPPGLYIESVNFSDITMPNGSDPFELFKIQRGDETHIMRLRVAVPEGAGFQLSDVLVRGQPLQYGSQIAEILRIRLFALARADGAVAPAIPCVGATPLDAAAAPVGNAFRSRFS